jgi:hypothetical protein
MNARQEPWLFTGDFLARALLQSAVIAFGLLIVLQVPVVGALLLIVCLPLGYFFPELVTSGPYVGVSFAWVFLKHPFAWLVFGCYFFVPLVILQVIHRAVLRREYAARQGRQPFRTGEWGVLMALLAVPSAVTASLLYDPLRMAQQARAIMEVKCKAAGERLVDRSPQSVEGVYFESDGGEYFQGIKENGRYRAYGSGTAAERLVRQGLLVFAETPSDGIRRKGVEPSNYQRYKAGKTIPVNAIESEFGLFQKVVVSPAERELGILGVEAEVRNMKTNAVVATTTYFVNSRRLTFCGHAVAGEFELGSFVVRALNLTPR